MTSGLQDKPQPPDGAAEIPVEETVVALCIQNGRTLATAESCTGGLIAHRITNVPGASAIFPGGIVAYANAIKTALLDVPEPTLAAGGAVAEAVAVAMAQGARTRFGADFAVAVTGIAGPGGGTPEKPVGTVYMAAAGPGSQRTRHARFTGDRDAIKAQTAETALKLLLEVLENE